MASTPPALPTKVFIDSSVLVATAISVRGSARELLNAGIRGHYELFASQIVLAETERNIALKAPAALPMFRMFEVVFAAGIVHPSKERVLEVARIVELKDAPIVAGAIEAGAQYLATYDRRHLLNAADRIHKAFGVNVETPFAILRASGEGLKPG
ncbi:MAG: PIN domain-containing protein [Chloroflexota bacterium]|nr:MAG: hypothetical protein DLM70_13090 [Chloroflexota bacterium]